MPKLILSELIEEVRACHGGRPDLTDARIVRALNMAQETIAKVYDPVELERHVQSPTSLLAHQVELLFSAIDPIPRKIISITLRPEDGRERKLIGMSERNFNASFPKPDADAEDIPAVYVRFADKVRFYPIPDLVYPMLMSVVRIPISFSVSNLTAISSLEAPDQGMIYWAASYLYFTIGEITKGREMLGLYKDATRDLSLNDNLDEPDRLISAETMRLTMYAGNSQPWNNPLIRRIR